jgi:hypothetical protein
MFYWLTKYSLDELINLFKELNFYSIKNFLNISLKITLCFIIQKQNWISIHFNYVQIQNTIPISIQIVNHTDFYHFILLSFHTQKIENKIQIGQCQQNQTLSIPYQFYCQISDFNNRNEIFFFNNQCFLLNQTNCIKQLIQTTINGEQKHITKYLNQNREKKKSCGFKNAIFVPRIINYTTTTG